MNRFIIGNSKQCIGCGTCKIACSSAHFAQGLQAAPRLDVIETKMVSVVSACHHCEGSPCAEVCPVGIIKQTGDHIQIDEKNCIGCKLCALICPFGAIHPFGTAITGVAGMATPTPQYSKAISPLLNWEIGVHTAAVKCDLCYFDERGPNCIRVCPTDAIVLIDTQNMELVNRQRKEDTALEIASVVEGMKQQASQSSVPVQFEQDKEV